MKTAAVAITTTGFSGTKTAGTCAFTIANGLITNVTGCYRRNDEIYTA